MIKLINGTKFNKIRIKPASDLINCYIIYKRINKTSEKR